MPAVHHPGLLARNASARSFVSRQRIGRKFRQQREIQCFCNGFYRLQRKPVAKTFVMLAKPPQQPGMSRQLLFGQNSTCVFRSFKIELAARFFPVLRQKLLHARQYASVYFVVRHESKKRPALHISFPVVFGHGGKDPFYAVFLSGQQPVSVSLDPLLQFNDVQRNSHKKSFHF